MELKSVTKLSMGSPTENLYLRSGMQEYKKCFVGYVDVLGFTKKVLRSDNPETLSESFNFLLESIGRSCGLETDFKNQDSLSVKFIWMSDNLLFYTEDNSVQKFKDISNIIADLLMITIEGGPFLYRGALSHGDFYFDREWNLYFGPAMIDAIQWEKKQNWVGVMLTPNCSDFIKKNNYDSLVRRIRVDRGIGTKLIEISGPLVIEHAVPLKKEECKVPVKRGFGYWLSRSLSLGSHSFRKAAHRIGKAFLLSQPILEKPLCINWTVNTIADKVEPSMREVLSSLECETDQESIKEKVNNTIKFHKYCKQFEKRTVLQ
ncbi:MAG: hypothetical protein ABSH06_08565 [Thermodesulfobacteriota bacterium]